MGRRLDNVILKALREARKSDDDTDALAERYKDGQISRRQFLKFLGAGAGGAVLASSSLGYFAGKRWLEDGSSPTGRQTAGAGSGGVSSSLPGSSNVDLGRREGLTGKGSEDISPLIDQYFRDGNNVHIPAGTYRYDGSGIGGARSNCALVGSEQGVEFQRPDGATIRPNIQSSGGVMRVENITIRGKKPPGADQSRWRFDALESDSRCEIINVNHPDGTENRTDSSAFLTYRDHKGTNYFKNCFVKNFGNSSFYVNLGTEGGNTGAGPVIIDNCVMVDVNGAIRAGHDESRYINSTFVWRNQPPSWHRGGSLARGIRADHPGENMRVENCHFYYASGLSAGDSLDMGSQEARGQTSGVAKDIFIETKGSYGDVAGAPGWDYENINITGSASAPVSTGSKKPDLKLEDVVWMPLSQTVYPGDGKPAPAGTATAGSGDSVGGSDPC